MVYMALSCDKRKKRDVVYMTESWFKTISQKIETVTQDVKDQFNRKYYDFFLIDSKFWSVFSQMYNLSDRLATIMEKIELPFALMVCDVF